MISSGEQIAIRIWEHWVWGTGAKKSKHYLTTPMLQCSLLLAPLWCCMYPSYPCMSCSRCRVHRTWLPVLLFATPLNYIVVCNKLWAEVVWMGTSQELLSRFLFEQGLFPAKFTSSTRIKHCPCCISFKFMWCMHFRCLSQQAYWTLIVYCLLSCLIMPHWIGLLSWLLLLANAAKSRHSNMRGY